MEINKLLTPYNYTVGNISRIKYIVIHYVGATGGAEANCKYYANNKLNASAHYFVGFDGEIWQSVEDKNIAWSVGGSKYPNTKGGKYYGICTNSNSLSIEMCVRKNGNSWYFEDKTVNSTIELTKYLMEKYNIDSEHVIRHYDVTGKECPYPYVYNNTKHTWEDFKKSLEEKKDYEVGWHKDSNGKWWYATGTTVGSYIKNDWGNINGNWYWFDENGYAVTGWKDINNHRYYFDLENCWMLKGWQIIDNNWYYFEEDGDYQGALWHEKSGEYGALERWGLDLSNDI